MQKRVRLSRFDRELDGNLLWNAYQDESNVEFFRRMPCGMTKPQVLDMESSTSSQIFTVLWDENPVGFSILTNFDAFSLTVQTGLLLFPEYRDKIVDNCKIAFWALFRQCKQLFDKTNIRKVSVRFLKSRKDLEKSLIVGGFKKEGDFRESTYCYGQFQDELEYALYKINLIEPSEPIT